ncbi:MAG: hypothetical protein HGA82_03720 [Anaerolineales bacterium]|nr:hypothetical protein [Anaerolineales bacterium]
MRYAFGKHYTNEPMERTLADALAVGAKRLDVFFMSGLPQQTAESVLGTIDYCEDLLRRFGKDGRLIPFISPLAPFLDPGSRGYENPDEHGYILQARTLEQHRRLLAAPSWKYVLNYETRWMNRHQLADATYAAGKRLNRLKAEYGLAPAAAAEERQEVPRVQAEDAPVAAEHVALRQAAEDLRVAPKDLTAAMRNRFHGTHCGNSLTAG